MSVKVTVLINSESLIRKFVQTQLEIFWMLRCVKSETHIEAQDAKVAVDAKRGPDDFEQPGVGVVVHCLDKLFDHVQLSLPPPGVVCVCVCVSVCECARV